MPRKVSALLPATDERLRQLGERLRLARLRRRLSIRHVAERAGMVPMTLRHVERGGSGVTIGAYLAVMQVLGIEKDLDLLAQADPLGRALQDASLPSRTRKTKAGLADRETPTLASIAPVDPRAVTTAPVTPRTARRPAPRAAGTRPQAKPADAPRTWIEKGGFANAGTLAKLLDPAGTRPPKGKRR